MNISEFKYLLWDNTRKINDAVNYTINTCASKYGLSGMQLRILTEIKQNGPHTVGRLANNVLTAGANISSLCKKLEGMEMLTRVRDHKDERVVKIKLTEKGQIIMDEVNAYFEKNIVGAMGADLSESLEIIAALETINEFFTKLNKQDMEREK